MNYKAIFLSTLLIPFAIMSNTDIETRIQELKNDQYEKEQELAHISEIIEEKELLIESMMGAAIAFAAKKYTSPDERSQFSKEIIEFGKRLDDAVATGNINDVFIKEIFDDANDSGVGRIRSIMIRRYTEQLVLLKLVKLYEAAFQKYLEINLELETLQK